MNKKVDAIIESSKDALINSIQESIRFPSVEGEPKAGAPFGEAVNDALLHALNLGREMGFLVTNLDGYAGCIDYGEGEEMLGIVCHLDVVPEGGLAVSALCRRNSRRQNLRQGSDGR